ncbi:hypothetical protein IV203_011483 [Nitzschia inconspicua]|uniref:protein-tyrosine-phosphatase n=1 Tax=Nitzschia inconspicua TaxID=303405 RepID=A0A9K3KSV0_9STRA|nr:hypothetical protein IV203_011483 [Nitzschia inconspicua]
MNDNGNNPEQLQVIVVGQNRPRLTKILSLIKELEDSPENMPQQPQQQQACHTKVSHEYLPCLAALDSYQNDETGESITYLSQLVTLDGSPMTKYLDDPNVRQSLKLVLMVGYEWKHPTVDQQNHIQSYFSANQLTDIIVQCASPNQEFESLQEEMQHFKHLSDEEKEGQQFQQTLGPWKMARFVVDSVQAWKREQKQGDVATKHGELEAGATQPSSENEGHSDDVVPATAPTIQQQEQTSKQQHTLRIDPTQTIFACRMCRTPLLDENHLAEGHQQNLHTFKRSHSTTTANRHNNKTPCQSLFCDETVLDWLSDPDGTNDVEGRLRCYKCSHKLGHWNWSGAQCSCGTWVVPAIQIPVSKVDAIVPRDERTAVTAIPVVMPRVFS